MGSRSRMATISPVVDGAAALVDGAVTGAATLAREGTGSIHAPREIKGATRSTTRRMGSKRQQPSPGDTCDASPDKTQSEGAADDEGGTA